ncbi:MAG: PilZ domain-containing protein [Planctomycetota bacterium]|nr:PilZ domain-containing protein [Planctomycetota bacterium]
MTTSFDYERRQFIRLPLAVPVRYKFLSREMRGEDMEVVHEGLSQNVGAGGLLLRMRLPNAAWLSKLLTRKMYVGVNMILPNAERPVKALCRAIWSSSIEGDTGQLVMGLEFQEVTNKDRDLITQYIIKAQMPA